MFTVTNQTLNQEKGNWKMVAKMYDVFTCPCSFSRQHSGIPKRKKLVFLGPCFWKEQSRLGWNIVVCLSQTIWELHEIVAKHLFPVQPNWELRAEKQ